MNTNPSTSERSRPRGTRTRPRPGQCNWGVSVRCNEAAEVRFESGLGYCRAHAEAVIANREWLQNFVDKLQPASPAQKEMQA
ncbi:MAG: hypothetical protein ACRD4X_09730 [Candidatus Acidiferrales bacterium]